MSRESHGAAVEAGGRTIVPVAATVGLRFGGKRGGVFWARTGPRRVEVTETGGERRVVVVPRREARIRAGILIAALAAVLVVRARRSR